MVQVQEKDEEGVVAIDLREYADLRKQSEELKSKADKAEGALQQLMERLKSEFRCCSIEEAESLLSRLTASQEKAEADYERQLGKFKQKWGGKFDDNL